MKVKRTVTIELDRVKITTDWQRPNLIWCEICQEESGFISQMETVELMKIMQIQGLNVSGENLHLYQPDEAQTFVCLSSIISGDDPKS